MYDPQLAAEVARDGAAVEGADLPDAAAATVVGEGDGAEHGAAGDVPQVEGCLQRRAGNTAARNPHSHLTRT